MENNDSEQPKKRRQRKRRASRAPSVAANVRIPAKDWEKLEWEAIARGVERPDVIRQAVSDAVKNARPPGDSETVVILGFTGQRATAWLALAKRYKIPVGEVAAQVMDEQCEKVFGTAPVLRDGEWYWPGIKGEETA